MYGLNLLAMIPTDRISMIRSVSWRMSNALVYSVLCNICSKYSSPNIMFYKSLRSNGRLILSSSDIKVSVR